MKNIFLNFFMCLASHSFSQNCFHTSLSNQFNIKVELKENTVKNPDFDSLYVKISITAKTGNVIQVIRKNPAWLWDNEFNNCSNIRSYSTLINQNKQAVDNDFGDLIVADLNFDGKDDFAIIYDSGGNSGPTYHFYIQQFNGKFQRNVFLSEEMAHFPSEINSKKMELKILTHTSANSVGERVFALNSKSDKWYLKSQRRIRD